MNMDFLDKHTVLVLNSLWMVIGTSSPKKALIAMNSESSHGNSVAKSISIEYGKKDDGSWDLENVIGFQAHSFEEWLNVPIRKGLDQVIHGSKISIRCPSIIMTPNFSKMPMRRIRPTKAVLYEKQQGICGYSGKKMSMKAMNLEHKHPKSFGGKDTFQNLMLVDTKINHARGNKPLEQLGLRPLFNHKEPQPLPVAYAIKSSAHPDWRYFLQK
jgi:5-methylcytosine-specific restriction endonuclease McrA